MLDAARSGIGLAYVWRSFAAKDLADGKLVEVLRGWTPAYGRHSLYYPSRERSFGNTASEWSIDMGIDGASFLVREFWPDINRKLFHRSNSMRGTQR